MKAWLIYTKEDAISNKSYINWFISEAKQQQIDMQLVCRDELYISIQHQHISAEMDGKIVDPPDFIVIRTIEPMLQKCFEHMQIPTFNPSDVATICNDKTQTYIEMSSLGIPIMPSYFFKKDSLPAKPPFPFPFVLKSATGRGGKEVFMIHSQNEWETETLKTDADEVIIQTSNHLQLGKDVRVFVIGKEIIAAVLRHNQHDFRANFKLGGTASLFTLTNQMTEMIHKIINHFDFGLVGIDFLLTEHEDLVFNEIEDVVGSRILSETTDINLLEKYITFIKDKVKRNEQ